MGDGRATPYDGNLIGEFRMMEKIATQSAANRSHDPFTCAVQAEPWYNCLDITSFMNSAINISEDGMDITHGASGQIFGQSSLCDGKRVSDRIIDGFDLTALLYYMTGGFADRDDMNRDPSAVVTGLQGFTDVHLRCGTNESYYGYYSAYASNVCANGPFIDGPSNVDPNIEAQRLTGRRQLEQDEGPPLRLWRSTDVFQQRQQPGFEPPPRALVVRTRLWVEAQGGSWYQIAVGGAHVSVHLQVQGVPWPQSHPREARLSNHERFPRDGNAPARDPHKVQLRFARHCEYRDECRSDCAIVTSQLANDIMLLEETLLYRLEPTPGRPRICPIDLFLWVPAVYGDTSKPCVEFGVAVPTERCTPETCECRDDVLEPIAPPPYAPPALPPPPELPPRRGSRGGTEPRAPPFPPWSPAPPVLPPPLALPGLPTTPPPPSTALDAPSSPPAESPEKEFDDWVVIVVVVLCVLLLCCCCLVLVVCARRRRKRREEARRQANYTLREDELTNEGESESPSERSLLDKHEVSAKDVSLAEATSTEMPSPPRVLHPALARARAAAAKRTAEAAQGQTPPRNPYRPPAHVTPARSPYLGSPASAFLPDPRSAAGAGPGGAASNLDSPATPAIAGPRSAAAARCLFPAAAVPSRSELQNSLAEVVKTPSNPSPTKLSRRGRWGEQNAVPGPRNGGAIVDDGRC